MIVAGTYSFFERLSIPRASATCPRALSAPAYHDVGDVELLPDMGHVLVLALEGEGGGTGPGRTR